MTEVSGLFHTHLGQYTQRDMTMDRWSIHALVGELVEKTRCLIHFICITYLDEESL